jgi:hypothetical protein
MPAPVMPAKAGIQQGGRKVWIPACAGVTRRPVTVSSQERIASGMHARAFGDLVDELLVLA